MLHASLLPGHAAWARLLTELDFYVTHPDQTATAALA
jgi:hypothetical protein